MTTLFYSHPAGLEHLTPPGHPERPDRLRAIYRVLESEHFAPLGRREAPWAERESVFLCHPESYLEAIRSATPEQGFVSLDNDTVLSPGSFEAGMRAVGGATAAVDALFAKEANNAFVAMRPPGHHAEHKEAMGFCLFNTAAIAARYAQKKHGIARVAVVDFDVHHGNGTQDIFWADPSVMYCSTHEMPLYPGTGAAIETGAFNTIVNAPLNAGDSGTQFREAMTARILPRVADFAPELIVISAGFDAHERDPLADLNFKEDDFAWITGKLMDLADKSAGGRLVSVLEGGYDLVGLGRSVAAHLLMLMDV